MTVLVDTNILVRTANALDKGQSTAAQAILSVLDTGRRLAIARQSLYEFWVVATRPPAQNGLGLTVSDAVAHIEKFESYFRVLPESDDLYSAWKKLVSDFQVKGKPAHDARLVALMQTSGIAEILTFNGADFVRYKRVGISVLNPQDFAQKPQN
jgi:predicted nucleic acid-binding protein